MGDGMERACVFDIDLQRQLEPHMRKLKPLPSIYYPDFIAANQGERADNLIPPGTKQQDVEHLRADIRKFKADSQLDKVVVLWTANTERFTDVRSGLNTTADEVLASIARNEAEVSQSNGSPQNTLTPGVVELAGRRRHYLTPRCEFPA